MKRFSTVQPMPRDVTLRHESRRSTWRWGLLACLLLLSAVIGGWYMWSSSSNGDAERQLLHARHSFSHRDYAQSRRGGLEGARGRSRPTRRGVYRSTSRSLAVETSAGSRVCGPRSAQRSPTLRRRCHATSRDLSELAARVDSGRASLSRRPVHRSRSRRGEYRPRDSSRLVRPLARGGSAGSSCHRTRDPDGPRRPDVAREWNSERPRSTRGRRGNRTPTIRFR